MIAAALIVFREVLEAALVIAVIMGATKSLKGRAIWVGWGIFFGVLGACVVAALMSRISQSLSGTGLPIFEAAVLLGAVLMLGWHNIWMSKNGKLISADLKRLGHEVEIGHKPMISIFTVAAIAVLREGSEIVLFLYGVAASGATASAIVFGGLFGISAGIAVGFAIYLGLMKIPVRYFFQVTGWMILLLAAGMASQAAAFLNQADLLPAIKDSVWNTSWIVDGHSFLGVALKALIGYTPSPSGLQLIFYVTTLIAIGSLMKLVRE